MNKIAKFLLWVFASICMAVVLIVILALLHKQGRLGHSDFFESVDVNQNSALSYKEWMTHYSTQVHNHSVETCMRADFYHADCDQDDVLTWREYHDFRFRRKHCESAAVPTLRKLFELDPSFGQYSGTKPYALSAAQGRSAQKEIVSRYTFLLLEKERELRQTYSIENKYD